ncbi:TolC family protein [Methylobacterium sp. JK268]
MPVRRAVRRRRGLVPAAILLTLAGAPAARAQGPEDASTAALESSFALRAEEARQEGAQARLRGALDAFMPTVTFTADRPLRSRITYAPNPEPTVVGLDSTPRRAPTVVGLTASLPLFDGFRRWHALQSAQTLAEAGRQLLIGKREQVLLDTGLAYLAVLRDARILAAREAQLAATQRIAAFTEKQLDLADATRTDLALARSRVQEAEALRTRARADLAASRLDFTRLTGLEPEQVRPPRLPDGLPRNPDAYADLVRRANPSIAATHLEAEAAGHDAQAAVSDLLPKVNLQFSKVAQLGYSPSLDRITDTTTRVVASVPLYEPGTLPRIGEASALALQRGYEARDAERTTLATARTAFARRQATAEQYAQLVARVGELRATMRGFGIERGAGFRTVLDELNIQGELANAEVAAELVRNERDGQTLQLAAAAGLLAVERGPRLETLASFRRAAPPAEPAPLLRGSEAPGAPVRPLPAPVLRASLADAAPR